MYKIIKAWLSKKVNKSRTTQKVYNGWDRGLLLKVKKKKKVILIVDLELVKWVWVKKV